MMVVLVSLTFTDSTGCSHLEAEGVRLGQPKSWTDSVVVIHTAEL